MAPKNVSFELIYRNISGVVEVAITERFWPLIFLNKEGAKKKRMSYTPF